MIFYGKKLIDKNVCTRVQYKYFLMKEAAMHLMETLESTGQRQQFGQVKRKYQRAEVGGFHGNLADGRKVIGGVVDNISTGGFAFTHVPESFSAEKHSYTAVLSGGGKHYKLLAKPCWRKKKENNTIQIGFKILDAPWEWVDLTMKMSPAT
jgi:hypothetical protein